MTRLENLKVPFLICMITCVCLLSCRGKTIELFYSDENAVGMLLPSSLVLKTDIQREDGSRFLEWVGSDWAMSMVFIPHLPLEGSDVAISRLMVVEMREMISKASECFYLKEVDPFLYPSAQALCRFVSDKGMSSFTSFFITEVGDCQIQAYWSSSKQEKLLDPKIGQIISSLHRVQEN